MTRFFSVRSVSFVLMFCVNTYAGEKAHTPIASKDVPPNRGNQLLDLFLKEKKDARPAAFEKDRSSLYNWLRMEFHGRDTTNKKPGLIDLYSPEEIPGVLSEIETVLTSTCEEGPMKGVSPEKDRQDLARRRALLSFLFREYERAQRFKGESQEQRTSAMRRFSAELEENFTAFLWDKPGQRIAKKEGEATLKAYRCLAQDLEQGSAAFTNAPSLGPTSNTESAALEVSGYLANGGSRSSGEDQGLFADIKDDRHQLDWGMVMTPWIVETRREVLDTILGRIPPRKLPTEVAAP